MSMWDNECVCVCVCVCVYTINIAHNMYDKKKNTPDKLPESQFLDTVENSSS